MTGTLPKFSRGLKLVRIGVLIMLLQLVIAIVLAVKSFGIDTHDDAREALKWTQYLFLANIAAGLAMFIGAAQSIGELKRTGVGAGELIAAAIGFAITTAAMFWTYKVLSNFVDILLHLEHHEMDDLLKVEPGHGVTVDNNDLILDPTQLVPPPLIRGKVTSVRVADGALVQTFGSGARQRLSPPAVSRNYLYWRGGKLQFGKLTMTDTDLELVDEDPDDPFDFSIDQWNEQLVAGYSKNTPNRGLKAHMPDHNDLNRQTTAGTAGKR